MASFNQNSYVSAQHLAANLRAVEVRLNAMALLDPARVAVLDEFKRLQLAQMAMNNSVKSWL